MARKVTIYLDKALRADQMLQLAEHALEWGLEKARTRVAAYEAGKKRPRRRNLVSVAKIAEDLGMTLPQTASRLVRQELKRHRRRPAPKKLPAKSQWSSTTKASRKNKNVS
jgi:hypothetical protein